MLHNCQWARHYSNLIVYLVNILLVAQHSATRSC